jgi:hypothetical protein
MNKLLVCFLLFLPVQIVTGQDKIITVQKDTIDCRIVSISPTHIHYEQKKGQYAVGQFMPVEQVLEYFRSPQSQAIDPYYRAGKRSPKPPRPWLIGIQAGGSSLLASSANDEQEMIDFGISKSQAGDYSRQLKHGFHLNGDIHYLITNLVGVGVKYSFFTSSAQVDFKLKIDDYYPVYSTMGVKEKQYINYAGPSILFQQYVDEKHKFQLSEMLSVGYVHYRDELRMNLPGYLVSSGYGNSSLSALVEGHTWGGTAGLSLDYYPLSWLSVGANAGFMYARLTEVDMSDQYDTSTVELSKQEYVKLSRLDYSISIRLHF